MASESNGVPRESLTARRIGKDWTQGSIFKNLMALSWPMAVTQTLMMLGPTIDMVWVGKLGPTAIAAVGISGVIVMLAQSAMMGLTNGMRALIARSIGAKDIDTANRAAQHAVIITAFYSIFMIILGFFSEEIVALVRPSPEVIAIGVPYLQIQLIGGAAMSFRMMMDGVMQASGDSMNPMWVAVSYRLVHIALCPFLIFGWWIFPEMGVQGAAVTAVVSQSIGVILGFRILFGARSRLKLTFKGFRFDFGIIWRIVRIGFPALIAGVQRTLNQFVLQIFIAPFGTVALAAHTINTRFEWFMCTPAIAFGMGAGVLVGQNLGAKQPGRAEKSAWLAVGLVEALAILASVALFIWTGPAIRIFNSEPDMVAMGGEFLRIALVGYLAVGFMFVLMNCLQGAGDTVPMMIISIITTWLITIPLAYYLPKYTDWGVYGIRWAMTASMLVAGVANIIYFRTGKWKTRRV
ncbi:MAG: MATE family efflux transporter [Dehalococcoidales bacterium]|nr:MATE family efflux transporter [Dehalococcoidales bacterium]